MNFIGKSVKENQNHIFKLDSIIDSYDKIIDKQNERSASLEYELD